GPFTPYMVLIERITGFFGLEPPPYPPPAIWADACDASRANVRPSTQTNEPRMSSSWTGILEEYDAAARADASFRESPSGCLERTWFVLRCRRPARRSLRTSRPRRR